MPDSEDSLSTPPPDDSSESPGTLPAPTEPSPPTEKRDPPSTDNQVPPAPTETMVSGSTASSSKAPWVPGYTVVHQLGTGTYGEVWLYKENHSNRRVAIKFLTRQTNQQWLTLQAEVMQLALLDGDPGIVQLKKVEPDAEPPYYVMTYAEKGSLARTLNRGPMPLQEALEIFQRVTEALAYVHSKGVRHCDLKPGNILLDSRGRPLLADFGQALLADTTSSTALGTLFFMAPEQASLSCATPDPRWDVYALGALLYTMLVGKPPRYQEAAREKLKQTKDIKERLAQYQQTLQKAPPPHAHRLAKGVDRYLGDIIDRCLQLDPAKRYPDAGAVLAAIKHRQGMLRLQPFLLFGLMAPILLLLMVGIFARWAIVSTLESSEKALVRQWQQNALISAQLTANVIEEKLIDRAQIVELSAQSEPFRMALTQSPENGPALGKHLKRFAGQTAPIQFDAWFLADPNGNLLAYCGDSIVPVQEIPVRNYRWRDWFHGQGSGKTQQGKMWEPIHRTHISEPYVGRRRTEEIAVAISTPVYEIAKPGAKPRLLGVLAARFPVRQLHQWLSEVKLPHGFPILVNDRCQYVLHRDMKSIMPNEARGPVAHPEHRVLQQLIQGRKSMATTYTDPINDLEYLVGCAPCRGKRKPEVKWGAMVQHNRRAALRPIEQLRKQLYAIGGLTLASLAILTLLMWIWLFRAFRRAGELR